MKRDMDLVRKIAFAIETRPHHHLAEPVKIDGYDDELVGFNCFLMMDGGLIKGFDTSGRGTTPQAIPFHLTWAGCEFADAARSDTLWQKAKANIKDKVGGAAIGLLTDYLKYLAKEALGMSSSATGE